MRDWRGFGEKQRKTRFDLRNKGFEKQRLRDTKASVRASARGRFRVVG